jgi:NhaP-type Na+/H+ or K+/H+ antiporter
MDEPLFGLSSYHVAMVGLGASIIVAYWLPRFFSGREPAASALLIVAGLGAFSLIPGMPAAVDPRTAPKIWEITSELAVIISLFGTGLRIDNLTSYARWRPTVRLLAILMPMTIVAVALLGWALAGMTLAGAILLGAVLAPTDPVLAGDVQVGRPTEGGEHPVRFSLTTEAGLNDGLAFPFVVPGPHRRRAGHAAARLGAGMAGARRDLPYRSRRRVRGGNRLAAWQDPVRLPEEQSTRQN